jgi:NhaP-type Na+/H+ or K+/H+ antiporter
MQAPHCMHQFSLLLSSRRNLDCMASPQALITFVAVWIFPYGWSWSESWLFGAIVSAVDPVAVVAIMKAVSLQLYVLGGVR